MTDKGKPESGKVYALTGGTGAKCISNGNTWAESEVKEEPVDFDEVANILNKFNAFEKEK